MCVATCVAGVRNYRIGGGCRKASVESCIIVCSVCVAGVRI